MRKSRYVWLIVIVLVCFMAILAWESPGNVWMALADPHFTESPHEAIQKFWGFMDDRQVKLARGFVQRSSLSSEEQKELLHWEQKVLTDSLFTLQKVEILEQNDNSFIVRTFWNSPPDNQVFVFKLNLQEESEGWRIKHIKRIDNLSLGG